MQRVQILLEDDIDGTPADETVCFGIDGKVYEIDLSTRHAGELRDDLARYVQAARTGLPSKGRTRLRNVRVTVDYAAVRAWGRSNGFNASDRGRPSQELINAYRAAGN